MMTRRERKDVLIILPAYNEQENIGTLLDALQDPDIRQIADILVMNDGSKDRTAQIVKEKGIPVVTNVYNLGYGSSLQVGYKYAVRNDYSYVIQMDADCQHDPCNVMDLYRALTTADDDGCLPDIVLGSRFVKGSGEYRMSAVRRFAIRLFSGMIYWMAGKKIQDPTTGLQGLSRRTVMFYSQYAHFDDKYPDANMILQMQLLGFRIVEIPSVMHMRTQGVSMHSGLKPIIYMFRMMVSLLAAWVRVKCLKMNVGIDNEDIWVFKTDMGV